MEVSYAPKTKLAVVITAGATLEITRALLGYDVDKRHHAFMVHTFAGTSLTLQVSASGTLWLPLASITSAGILNTGTGIITYPFIRLVHVGTGGCTFDVISKHVPLENRWA